MSSTLNYILDMFFNPKLENAVHFVPLNYQKNVQLFLRIPHLFFIPLWPLTDGFRVVFSTLLHDT